MSNPTDLASAEERTFPPTQFFAATEQNPQALIGSYCVCSIGYIARVEKFGMTPYGKLAWTGTSLHGKPWSSTRPIRLTDADAAVIAPLFASIPPTTELSRGLPR